MAQKTRLGAHGVSSALLGSFAGKTEVTVLPASLPAGGGVPVIIFSNTSSVGVALPASREWILPSDVEPGEATIFVPYGSPAAAEAYIDDEAASRVKILDVAGSGEWNGYVTNLTFEADGVTVTAVESWGIVNRRHVALNQTLRNVTAGEIFSEAISYTPLKIGTVVAAPPALETYVFHGETVGSVIADLVARTGMDFYINADDCASFGPAGSAYDTILMAGGNLQEWSYSANSSPQASSVTYLSDMVEETASAALSSSPWLDRVVVKAESGTAAELAAAAAAEMEVRKYPEIALAGSVPSSLFDLQIGDTVSAWTPQGGWGGGIRRFRVVSRIIDEASERMYVEFVIVRSVAPAATGSAAIPVTRRPTSHRRRSLKKRFRELTWYQQKGRRYLSAATGWFD